MARFAQDTAPAASDIPNTPAGNIAATDVQAAINELDGDKAGFADAAPAAASESSGDITLDVADGRALSFTRTMGGNETLLDPVDMPDGVTVHLRIDPDGNTLSYDTGYVGTDLTNGSLPAVSTETLMAITRSGSEYIATAIAEV